MTLKSRSGKSEQKTRGLELTEKGTMEWEKLKKDFSVQEMSYGEFVPAVSLPAGVDADETGAIITDGILEVSVPKRGVVNAFALS